MWIGGQRTGEKTDSVLVLPALTGQQTGQAQRVRMRRIRSQNLLAKQLSPSGIAALQSRDSGLETGGGVHCVAAVA
jgi:hypothetical protein